MLRSLLLTRLLLSRRGSTVQRQSRISRLVADLVFGVINKVPPFNKVATEILNDCTMQAHGNIGPSHARHALPIQLIVLPVNNILEIKDARIIVVLARENRLVYVRRVQIRQRMLICIPTTEAHVQTAHKCSPAVNQAKLFVMGPIENDVVVHSIQSLECVFRHPAQAGRVKGHVLEGRGN